MYDPHSKIKTTLTFNDLPHLGIWGLKDSPYICIEPWQGCDDHLNQEKFDEKFGIANLSAGSTGKHTITIDLAY